MFPLSCLLCATLGVLSSGPQLLRTLPLVFEPNTGQWNSAVQFSARAGGYRLSLTKRGAVVSAPGKAIEISLMDANPAPAITGLDPLPSRSNYFVGGRRENWRTGVAHYRRVRYREVYPGIDLIYYGHNEQLEYDFVLAPGADPNRIRLRFGGAGRLELTPAGDLVLPAGDARLIQKRPRIYQNEREIAGRYTLLGANMAVIELGAYDRSQPVTIDPVLVYSSLLGGSGVDAVTAIKTDAAGMVYVAGYVSASDLTASDAAPQPSPAGNTDAFVAKINPNASGGASLVYFTYIGGSATDTAADMVLDAAGNVYLTGSTNSTDFPTAGSAHQTSQTGTTSDAFVVKLNPALAGKDALLYSTYLGGGENDTGSAIGVDASGAIYVTGTTRSGDFPVTGSAVQNGKWGTQDAFIAKLDPNSSPSLVYSSFFGGDGIDEGRALAIAPSGTVYLAGTTSSRAFGLVGNSYRTETQGVDIFLAWMDLTKSGQDSLVYATFFGGSGADAVRRMVLDASGKLLLTGYTLSKDFPVTPDALQSTPGGNGDVFISKLDPAAPRDSFVAYSTYFGGSGGDVAYDIATDAAGNVYVTGYTLSKDFPVTQDAVQGAYGGGVDVFLSKIDPAKKTRVYSTYLGGTGTHVGYAIAASSNGTVYVGGQTGMRNIPVTDGAFQNSFAGGLFDGFLVVVGEKL